MTDEANSLKSALGQNVPLSDGLDQTAEQQARDMLERMGVEDAQSFTAGDLVELANLIAHAEQVEKWKAQGGRLFGGDGFTVALSLGAWWADRPWRNRD
jgi:hypothetical protein